MKYRICTVQPSRLAQVEDLLASMAIPYVAPKYRTIRRYGRKRLRAIVEVPAMPGVIFIPAGLYEMCHKHLGNRTIQLRAVKNPVSEDGWAFVDSEGLQPMIGWLVEQEELFERKLELHRNRPIENKAPAPVARPAPRGVGESVTITGGPFSGVLGQVVADDGLVATITLQSTGFEMQISSCHLATSVQ